MYVEKNFETQDGGYLPDIVASIDDSMEKLDCIGSFQGRALLKSDIFITGTYAIDLVFDNSSHEDCGDYNFQLMYDEYIKAEAKGKVNAAQCARALLLQYISEFILFNYERKDINKAEIKLDPIYIDKKFSNNLYFNTTVSVPIFSDEPELGSIKLNLDSTNYTIGFQKIGILCKTFSEGGVVKIFISWLASDRENLVKSFIEHKDLITNDLFEVSGECWRRQIDLTKYFKLINND